VDIHLDEESKNTEMIQLKKRNDVYYKLYKDAKQKAKIARDLALTSYLEAKRIKNTYLLNNSHDLSESDEEDFIENFSERLIS
jgi:ABC-type transporter MlaC component